MMDININITLKNIDIKFSEKEDCLESAYRQIENLIEKKEIDLNRTEFFIQNFLGVE
tara:strand:+ start:871 stop:1041 length:171 start_codon:yes stop_codon:yes gene_type:complete